MSDLPPQTVQLLSWIEMLLRPVLAQNLRLALLELLPAWCSSWPSQTPRPAAVEVMRQLSPMLADPARLRGWLCEEAPLESLIVVADGLSTLDHWIRTRPAGDPEVEEFQRRLLELPSAGFVLAQGVALLGLAESGAPPA